MQKMPLPLGHPRFVPRSPNGVLVLSSKGIQQGLTLPKKKGKYAKIKLLSLIPQIQALQILRSACIPTEAPEPK